MIEIISRQVLPAAFTVLPAKMWTPEAHAFLLAIGLQESYFRSRRQSSGPARGFWQFEFTGVVDTMKHPATSDEVQAALHQLRYPVRMTPTQIHDALEHNDILAAVMARCLIWTLPNPLPKRDEVEHAWQQYIAAWRPGRPRINSWEDVYHQAWERTMCLVPAPGFTLRA